VNAHVLVQRFLSLNDNALCWTTLLGLPIHLLETKWNDYGAKSGFVLLIMDDEIQHYFGNLFMLLG
jgi:hypothetical protein